MYYYVLWFVTCSDFQTACSPPIPVQTLFTSAAACDRASKDWQGGSMESAKRVYFTHCRFGTAGVKFNLDEVPVES